MNRLDPEEVLDLLRERAPRAVHAGEVASRLGVPRTHFPLVTDALEALTERGLVTEMPGQRYRLAKNRPAAFRPPRHETIERPAPIALARGVLTLHPRGFGFVATDDGGPDVFVSEGLVGPALHGDRVEVDFRPSPKGREGAVVGILGRREPRISGTVRLSRGQTLFEPDDVRLRRPMIVEGPLPENVREGEAVLADLVRFPQRTDDQAGVIVAERLGTHGVTAVEVAKIKIRENVVEEFPEDVRAEARAVPKSVSAAECEGRVDLRDLDIVTIDPDDARDHDDALYCEATSDGGYRLIIAIADVSHYVREGTAIDREAVARCTSIYLPDRAIPMLPHEISSNIASLVPKKDRLCLAVKVELSHSGHIESYELIEGVMRSHARLTYGGVARALDLTTEGKAPKDAVSRKPMLQLMLDCARVLRKKRLTRGAIDFDLPEARVKLDSESGEPIDAFQSRRDPGVREAYRLVEEMMLLANEVVAADLTERGVPSIYRVHGRPDERKIELFCKLAMSLGHDLDPEDAVRPKALARFLARVEHTPEANVLRYLLLRAMQQAAYDTNPDIGHFGLAARDYLHFTSPIRRYPDLAVHRVVRKVVRGEPIDGAMLWPRLRMQAAESSRLERRAMSVERDVLNLYRALLMRDRLGDELEGTVTGVTEEGFHVTLESPFVETFVSLDRVPHGPYLTDELGIRLVSRTGHSFGLGDALRVRILDVALERRQVLAEPAEIPAPSRTARDTHRKKQGAGGRDGGRARREGPRAPEPAHTTARVKKSPAREQGRPRERDDRADERPRHAKAKAKAAKVRSERTGSRPRREEPAAREETGTRRTAAVGSTAAASRARRDARKKKTR